MGPRILWWRFRIGIRITRRKRSTREAASGIESDGGALLGLNEGLRRRRASGRRREAFFGTAEAVPLTKDQVRPVRGAEFLVGGRMVKSRSLALLGMTVILICGELESWRNEICHAQSLRLIGRRHAEYV